MEEYRGKSEVFKIATASKTYFLAVSDKEERTRWIMAIQTLLPPKEDLRKALPNTGVSESILGSSPEINDYLEKLHWRCDGVKI